MVLDRSEFATNPMDQFSRWFTEAQSHPDISVPEAMCIATIDANGFPDTRYVLMKHQIEDSLVFYTNLESSKGRSLLSNPKMAANFYWAPQRRQVRFKGTASLVDAEFADEYFASRSRGSQLGAWASDQSRILESGKILDDRWEQFNRRFEGQDIPRPNYWSGFRIFPHEVEFWQNRPNRLHDRFVYVKNDKGSWDISRLYP